MRRGVVALLLVALAGCRGESREEDAAETVRRAVATTMAAGSAQVSGQAALSDLRLLVEGTASFATGDASLRMSTKRVTDRDSPVRVETRIIGTAFYDRIGTTPTEWHTYRDASRVRIRARGFQPLGKVDLREIVRYLEGVTDAEREGTEDVHGARTRRYRGTLDLTRTPDTAEAIYRFGTSRAAFTAWIDEQGRLARIQLDVDALRLIGSSERGTLTATFDLYEFGVPVSVTPPPNPTVHD